MHKGRDQGFVSLPVTIAAFDARRPVAERLHHAHDLVPRDQRQLWIRQLTLDHVEVGPADAVCEHSQQHLAGTRRRSLDVAQLEPGIRDRSRARQHDGAHQ